MSQLPTPQQAEALEAVYADDAASAPREALDECRARGWVAGRGDHIVPTPSGAAALKAFREAKLKARDL